MPSICLARNPKRVIVQWVGIGTDRQIPGVDTNELQVNEQKTELVVFRKGGRLAQTDEIYCRGVPLRKKNFYKYLGITVQLTGKTFSIHILERLNATVRSISNIEHLQRISLKTDGHETV